MNYKYLFWLLIGLIIGYIYQINNIEGFKDLTGCNGGLFNHSEGSHIDNTDIGSCDIKFKIKIKDFFIQYKGNDIEYDGDRDDLIKSEDYLLRNTKTNYLNKIKDATFYQSGLKKIIYISLDNDNDISDDTVNQKMKIELTYNDNINEYNVYLYDYNTSTTNSGNYLQLISNTFTDNFKSIFTLYDKDSTNIYITLEVMPDTDNKLTKEKIKSFIYNSLIVNNVGETDPVVEADPIDSSRFTSCDGEWSPWSTCDALYPECRGTQTREFNVSSDPSLGGKSCPLPLNKSCDTPCYAKIPGGNVNCSGENDRSSITKDGYRIVEIGDGEIGEEEECFNAAKIIVNSNESIGPDLTDSLSYYKDNNIYRTPDANHNYMTLKNTSCSEDTLLPNRDKPTYSKCSLTAPTSGQKYLNLLPACPSNVYPYHANTPWERDHLTSICKLIKT